MLQQSILGHVRELVAFLHNGLRKRTLTWIILSHHTSLVSPQDHGNPDFGIFRMEDSDRSGLATYLGLLIELATI